MQAGTCIFRLQASASSHTPPGRVFLGAVFMPVEPQNGFDTFTGTALSDKVHSDVQNSVCESELVCCIQVFHIYFPVIRWKDNIYRLIGEHNCGQLIHILASCNPLGSQHLIRHDELPLNGWCGFRAAVWAAFGRREYLRHQGNW